MAPKVMGVPSNQVQFTDGVPANQVEFADEGPQGISPTRALLTNEPTSGFAEDIIRGIPATIGATIGGGAGLAAGAAGGPAAIGTMMAGAGVGGAGGEGLRQSAVQVYNAYNNKPAVSPEQVLGSMTTQGAIQGIGKGAQIGISAGLQSMAPSANKIGAQVLRAATGTKESTGMEFLRNPLRELPTPEVAKEIYKSGMGPALEGSTEAGRAIFGKTYPGPDAVLNTIDDLGEGLYAARPNELVGIRKAISSALKDVGFDKPALRSQLADRLEKVDGLIEKIVPDSDKANSAWRAMKIGEEMNSWLPLNKNLSPNALRTAGAIAVAAKSAGEGKLGGMLALPFISPRAWAGVIRTGARLAGPASEIAGGAFRYATGGAGEQSAQYIRKYIVAPSPIAQNYQSPR